MNAETLSLISPYLWIVILSLMVGGIVRALKPDTPIPVNVPAQYRALLALALGVFGGLVVKVFGIVVGIAWLNALLGGFVAGGMAIVGHETIIESVTKWKDTK
jgi:hypothetical protein